MPELNHQQFAGTTLIHSLPTHVVKAIGQGRVKHLSGMRGISQFLGSMAYEHMDEEPSKGQAHVSSTIKPGATVRLRKEGEKIGDEDITATHESWLGEHGGHAFEIHNPRAISSFKVHRLETGPHRAQGGSSGRVLKSWANDEFFHHTSDPAARDIVSRLHRGEPGLLLSRGGDTGPGIYTSADRTAWQNIGSRREHPGWEFAVRLRGHQSIGAGPGGSGLYDPDPHPRAARRFQNIGREGYYHPGLARHRGIDPNFWREHGIDTVVTGGKETVATHPLQVQVLRATNKATGRTMHFEDEVHRHYKRELRVQESDYSPRQEAK